MGSSSFGASGLGSRAPGISSVRLAEAGDKDRTSQGLGFRGDKELTSSYHNDSLGLRAYKELTSSHQNEGLGLRGDQELASSHQTEETSLMA